MQAPSKQQLDNVEDGFSSESDRVDQEQIQFSRPATTIQQQDFNKQIKDKLPPPQQIRQKSYSLKPDISTGWSQKIQLPKPFPITFSNYNFDSFITRAIKQNNKKARLVYLGTRYPTTFEAWHEKSFSSPYNHMPTPKKLKVTNRSFCGNRTQLEDCLLFDSSFESGNLDAVFKIGPKTYELFLRVDSNTRGHFQWYNFKVRNLKKNQKYVFSICNFQKKSSLYTRGARPYIFSLKKHENQEIGWQQDGQNIKYQQKLAKVFKIYKYDYYPMQILTFQYQTSYQNDIIQMAYSIPYTYTHLSQFLHRLMQSQKRPYLRMSKLCNTLGALEVPLLIINDTQEHKTKYQKLFTKCVIVSGRAHPGESNGSFMMEGFIKYLCGNSKQVKNLRKNVIFKIVPMLNPDGVVLGNYRTGLSGKDFNRQFLSPDPKIFPQVFAIKKLVTQNKQKFKDNFQLFLDFHGHSVKKNVFMYGPQFPIIHRHYYDCRVFPKLLADHTKMFRFYSCIFKVSQFKNSTARVVLLRKLNIPFSYTIQASNSSYYDPQILKDVPFNENSLMIVGQKIGEAIEEYIEIIIKSDKLRYEKFQNRKSYKQKSIQNKRSNYQYYNQYNIQRQKQRNQMGQLQKILSMQDQTIINLFSQIQKLQQKRKIQNQNYSQDQISEGSSDGEGQQDDLQDQKIGVFYDLLKKKNDKNSTYNHQDLDKFFIEQKQYKRNDLRLKKLGKINQSSLVIQLDKHEKRESQLLSKVKVSERKSFVFRNKIKHKKEQLITEKPKIHAPRIVSFGTGYIGFDSTTQQQQKTDKINIDNMISQSFKSKLQTGFLPNKVIDNDRMRQTHIFNKKNRSFDLGEMYMRESSLNKMRNKAKPIQSLRMKMIV